MKNKLLIFFTLLLSMIAGNVFSVDKNKDNGWCGTVSPGLEWENQIQRIINNQQIQSRLNGSQQSQQQIAYTIPVIVHICYYTNNSTQNINATRVQSQITTLNNDFAGIGVNSSTLPAPFAAVKANSNITFCLAKLDPNNNVLAEPGIERINAQTRGWGNPGTAGWAKTLIDGTIKPATIWDPNYYLNVWVVPKIESSGNEVIGYATFPGLTGLDGMPTGSGNILNDGFVCKSSFFGNNGANIGRTATHEIGHWLGLRHIWGDNGQCNGDDYCNDTPKQYGGTAIPAGCNYGCPTYPFNANLCNGNPNGDMFMNFMDYTNDGCMALFTNDQSARFQATMQFGDFRKNLKNSPACDTVKQKPSANFTSLQAISTLCATSKSFSFTDKSLFAPTSWSWTFQGGTPATVSGTNLAAKNPSGIVFNTPGLHDVTLVATNARGSSSITLQVNVPIVGTGTLPFSESFEGPNFPPLGWDLVNRNGNPAIKWDIMSGYSAYGIGNQCMRFDNTSLDGRFQKDDIMTPKLDFTGITQAKLKFDVSHAPYYGPITTGGPDVNLWDTLEVLITDNCQTTTQRLYRKGDSILATVMPGQGDEFYPAANQWRTDSVAIPAAYLNKPNVQIIFRNYGDYGHTIYIDNVNISVPNTTPTATASFTASDTTVCAGGSLTFTNTSTASTGIPDSVRWTIAGGVPGTSTSTTTVAPTFSTPGTYIISLVAYKSGNASAAATKSIRVKALPIVQVNSPAICSGTTASLLASGATTYSWSPNIGSIAAVTTPALTTTTTYTVTGTTQGCTGTAVSTVTVNATPNVAVNSPSICAGTTADLVASGATSYTWSPNIGSGASVTTPSLTTTTTYTVTGTTGTCSKTAVATVTVTALPNVAVNSPTICTGTTASLTATGATSYAWSPNIGSGASVTTPSLTTTTTYTVTGTTGTCSKTAVATVTVTAPPPVAVNSPSICSGLTASLTATGATSYTWSPNIGSGASVTTPSLTTTTTYTVTGTTGSCSATAVATVTVNATPNVTVNSPTICAGTTADLTAGGATSYSWSPNIGSGASVTTPSLTTTTTYTVTGTTGTCSKTAVATVTVTPLPNVTVTSPSVCSGSSATLQANGATTYTWTGGLASGATTTTPVLTATTTYTVTGTTGTCSKTAVATVTVNASAPTVTISSVPNPASVCFGDAITLTGNGANNYTWTSSQTGTTGGGTLNFTPNGNITVSLSGTVTGCSTPGTTSINITVKSKPTVAAGNVGICANNTADLLASGADTYSWSPNIGSGSNVTTPILTTTTTYTVTGTTNGCTNTALATVTVTARPNVSVGSTSICSGFTADLVASGANTYTWSPNIGSGSNVTTPSLTTTTTYTVTGTANSCTGTAVSTVTVNPTPATPGITQSGDTLYSSTIIVGASYQWYKGGVLQGTTSVPYYKLTSGGSYTLKVVNGSCTSAESAAFAAVYTGIKNATNSVKVFEVYPNPTEGRLVLNLNLTKSASVQIRMYTPEGRELYVKSFVSTRNVYEELSISDYSKGVYIIKLNVDDEVYYHKVVKQ
ncbi:MAG: T9SS type A sorting domain-containing protein [Sphingobacteriales bacterium]|nr:T9SS type A sorting domain-containing protein [Sphingobacteriales bacterium]